MRKWVFTTVALCVTLLPAPAHAPQEASGFPLSNYVRAAGREYPNSVKLVTEEPRAPERNVWDRLADCETGEWIDGGRDFHKNSARWDASDGTFQGGLQFHPGTWDAYKPSGFPDSASAATREQEIIVAERVLADQGWQAWPVCSRKLGLR